MSVLKEIKVSYTELRIAYFYEEGGGGRGRERGGEGEGEGEKGGRKRGKEGGRERVYEYTQEINRTP